MNFNEIKKREPVFSPVISVIIPFYVDKNDLSKCLIGLQKQNFNHSLEIIVIESGIDTEVNFLVNSIPNSILISCNSLLYPGKARNLGVKNSNADILAFIDADCVPSSNWLAEIYSSLNDGNEIVIGPVINLYPFHPIASIDNLFLFADFQKHRPSKNINHFAGCNFGITKELYYKTGGFPEELELAEDTKFSELALQKGKFFFNRNIIVKHSGRKNFTEFKKHHAGFGFYKGYLILKSATTKNKFRRNYFYPIFLGIRRLIYFSIRTLQWNPISLLRIIFFFPILIIGISAWIEGFRNGRQKFLSENTSHSGLFLENLWEEKK